MSEPPKILFDIKRPVKKVNRLEDGRILKNKPHFLVEVISPKNFSGGLKNKTRLRIIFCTFAAIIIFIANIFSVGSYAKKSLNLVYGEIPKIKKSIPELDFSDIVNS